MPDPSTNGAPKPATLSPAGSERKPYLGEKEDAELLASVFDPPTPGRLRTPPFMGAFDPTVLAAAARLSAASEPYLDVVTRKLRKRGVTPAQVDSWKRSVERHQSKRSLKLLSASELMNRPDPKFLVDGLVEEKGFGVLAGDSGVGKTVMAMDVSYCISEGIPWVDRETLPGPVVYVAAEGAGALGKRLRALVKHHERREPPKNLHFIDQAVNLMEKGSVSEAIAAVRAADVAPRLVVFDTYARSMVGGDENSAKDTGLVIEALDRLRVELDTATLVIHHTTKSNKSVERGSNALRGAADTELLLEAHGSGVKLIVNKQKNFEKGQPISLRLMPVEESVVPVRTSSWTNAVEEEADHRNGRANDARRIWEGILDSLKLAGEAGRLPINQTEVLRNVKGNARRKAEILHEMADDPDCPVEMEQPGGKQHLYRLRTS